MALKLKFTIFFCIIAAVTIFILYFILNFSIVANIRKIQSEHLIDEMSIINKSLALRLEMIQSLARDWAIWDESYEYIKNKDIDSIKEGITEVTFDKLQIDHMVFLEREGEVFGSANSEGDENLTVDDYKVIKKIVSLNSELDNFSGIMNLESGYYMMAFSKSYDSSKSLPSYGYIVFMKSITEALFDNLLISDNLKLNIITYKTDLPSDENSSSNLKDLYVSTDIIGKDKSAEMIIKNFFNEPILLMKLDFVSIPINEAYSSIDLFILILILSGVVCVYLFYRFVENQLIKRLKNIKNNMEEISNRQNISKRIVDKYDDEITSVAKSFNKMLLSIENYQNFQKIVVNLMPQIIFARKEDGSLIFVNDSAKKTAGEFYTLENANLSEENKIEQFIDFLENYVYDEKEFDNGELSYEDKNGYPHYFNVRKIPFLDPISDEKAYLHVYNDITVMINQKNNIEKRKNEMEKTVTRLEEIREMLQLALWGSQEEIWEWNIGEKNIFITQISNQSHDDKTVKTFEWASWKEIIHPEDAGIFWDVMNSFLQEKDKDKTFEAEYRIRNKEDEWIWVLSRGKMMVKEKNKFIKKVIGTHKDISLRKKTEKEMEKMAHIDILTGLSNRLTFTENLEMNIKRCNDDNSEFTLLYLDLDGFKNINDTLGHQFGDLILKVVSKRLLNSVDSNSLISRIGGDEFVIIVNSREKAELTARSILDSFRNPFYVDGDELFISASIGLAFFPEDGKDRDTLLKNADLAMYEAKKNGKNNYQVFNKKIEKEILRKVYIEKALRKAIDKQEFSLVYQPIIDCKTEQVYAFETLIRWRHGNDYISPVEFIEIAEETGQIIKIGSWVVEKSLIFLKEIVESDFKDIRMSINISPLQFVRSEMLLKDIDDFLIKKGLSGRNINLEITEGCLLNLDSKTEKIMAEFMDREITVSIDDFGTGYSSLSYLKKLAINSIKIDKSFIDDIPNNEEGLTIVKTILNLSENLGIKTVAEGVEEIEQLKYLKENHCDYIQGYYYSKPLTEKDALDYIKRNRGSL